MIEDFSKYKKLTNSEARNISLEILKNVSEFCEENNITYFLACGTLLGAVRHKGFIPWDDDVDIMMPRPDYNRFIELYNNEKYKVLKPDMGLYYFVKVYDSTTIKVENNIDYHKYDFFGIDIDIFPLDGIINNQEIIDKLYNKECFLEMLLRLSNQPIFYRKNPIKAINRILPRIIGSKNLVRMIEKNAQTYDYEKSDYVIRMRRSTNGFTGAMKKEVYEKDYLPFEDAVFCVPKRYKEWLTTFFGDDYMELPSIEKRITHNLVCYKK